MTKYNILAAVGLTVFAVQPALAQGLERPFEWTLGAAATTRLDASDGFSHAENELELFYEMAFRSGFHAGLTLTSLYDDPADDFEYELTFGYGADFGDGMSWDLTYGYIGLNESDDDSHEITGTLGFPLSEATEGSFAVILDPENGKSDQELGFETALNDQWSVVGLIGNSDRDDNVYAEIGVGYAINDAVSLEVLYEDTNDAGGLLGFTVSYAFGG